MLYSSGSYAIFQYAKSIVSSVGLTSVFASQKIETSDPMELDESYLKSELNLSQELISRSGSHGLTENLEENKAFVKPRGPARKVQ
jgi:twinfilin-like protein